MKSHRLVAPAKNEITLEPFTLPTLKSNDVLLEAIYTTISPGTELAWLQHQASTPGVYPWYPGYSGSARVLKLGNNVDSLKEGQLVACNMPHCSHVVMKASQCHVLTSSQDTLEASAFRLASIALQGVRKAQIQLGESVAVLGLGAIGNLAAQLSGASGATHVHGIDLVEYRQKIALACHSDAATVTAPDNAFDVVIEATGIPAVIKTSFRLANQRGRVILLGSPRGLSGELDFYTDVHRKGISIIGAHEINRASHDELLGQQDYKDEAIALKLLALKRIRTKPLITDVVSPNQAARAYERLAKREENLMLIAFDWSIL